MSPVRTVLPAAALLAVTGALMARAGVGDPADSNTAPAVVIERPVPGARWQPGQPIHFAADAVDVQDGSPPAAAYIWTLVIDDCTAAGCGRRVLATVPGVRSGTIAAPAHPFTSPLELELTVGDAAGLTTTAAVQLLPGSAAPSAGGCGDGMRDAGEECDDGNRADDDCCTTACRLAPADRVCRTAAGPCDVAETCGADGRCPADGFAPDGETCGDGDVCNGIEACEQGACRSAAPLDCRDDNPCTDDTCDPARGCVVVYNTASCDDGIACTAADVCSQGVCRGHSDCREGLTCNVGNRTCEAAPALPSPWRDAPASGGTARYDYANGSFALASDRGLRFVHQVLAGDGTITARVSGVRGGDPSVTAGVMMRDGVGADSRHAAVMLRADDLAAVRCVPAGAPPPAGATGATWVRLTRRGDRFEGACSADGVHWETVGTQTIPMGPTTLAGLAVSGADAGATFQLVYLTSGVDRGPGSALITSPVPGTVLPGPATVQIEVDAPEVDGPVTMVELFAGDVSIGVDLTRPYRFRWRDVPAGTYSLVARATDRRGRIVGSQPVTISVLGPAAPAPTLGAPLRFAEKR